MKIISPKRLLGVNLLVQGGGGEECKNNSITKIIFYFIFHIIF